MPYGSLMFDLGQFKVQWIKMVISSDPYDLDGQDLTDFLNEDDQNQIVHLECEKFTAFCSNAYANVQKWICDVQFPENGFEFAINLNDFRSYSI